MALSAGPARVPIYRFRCAGCGATTELLLRLGDNRPRPCPDCGGQMAQRFGRIGVRYDSWGFGATDSLVRKPGRTRLRELRERAERIRDE